jgi:hypothetical protein
MCEDIEQEQIQKQVDYDKVIQSIDSIETSTHIPAVENMINYFDTKWKPKNRTTDITETTELRGVLKYKIKKLSLPEII